QAKGRAWSGAEGGVEGGTARPFGGGALRPPGGRLEDVEKLVRGQPGTWMSSVDRCATFFRQVICDSRKRYRIAAGVVNGVRNVWVVTSVFMDVTTNSSTAPALLAVMCLGLGACSAPASDSTQGSTTVVVSCASAPLSVTFADLTVKAVNTGTSTCNLS